MFGGHEVADGRPVFHELRQLVDALVHAVAAHHLRAQEAARVGRIGQLDGQGQRAGIVAGMARRVGHRRAEGDALARQPLGRQPDRSHREVEHLGYRRAERAFIALAAAEGHVVGGDAGLAVGRPGQVVEPRASRQGMGKLYGVAHGIDVGRRGGQRRVHPDAARLADAQSRLAGQPHGRPHADGEQDEVGPDHIAAAQHDVDAPVPGAERRDGLFKAQADALGHEMAGHGRRHRVVERSHHLVAHLDERHRRTGMDEVFGHLQADEAAPDDHGAAHVVARKMGFDAAGVGHVAQREDALRVDALQGRAHGFGSGRKEEAVVSLAVRPAVGRPHAERVGRRVKPDHFVTHTHVDAIAAAERFGRLHKQAVALGDDAAEVIRQAAIGIRDVLAALNEDDFGRLVQPSQTGGRSGATGHAAHNDMFHTLLTFSGLRLQRNEKFSD